jgi:hypothetical protein
MLNLTIDTSDQYLQEIIHLQDEYKYIYKI